MNDLEAFAKLVQALDPWRGQLVFIGGWARVGLCGFCVRAGVW